MTPIVDVIKRVKPSLNLDSSDQNLFDHGGMDSYDMVMLITELEAEYSVIIPGEKMRPEFFQSVNRITELIIELKG